jgi:hypothetical protein
VAVGAVALAVGRLLPAVTHGARWPFRLLGIGYALLSVAILVVGATRQQRASAALRRGGFSELTSSLVAWLTSLAVFPSVAGMVLVAVAV